MRSGMVREIERINYRKREENNVNKSKDQNSKHRNGSQKNFLCPAQKKCGGCQLLEVPYGEQLRQKQKQVEKLLGPY